MNFAGSVLYQNRFTTERQLDSNDGSSERESLLMSTLALMNLNLGSGS